MLDTSTLVSAALRPDSVPRRAFQRIVARHEICVSSATLDELFEVLARRKFERYLEHAERMAFAELYRAHTRLFAVLTEVSDCRDPKHNKFLSLALTCAADVIVASDQDLLVLHPYRKIPVLTPAALLEDQRF
ncbi:MAG: putative toxin-antitoxin system toxin component, PIN family [Nevskia sp.]|nr:putative toxin-antitoxin system toxin component, PIN family [Nevskia sp.]